MSERGSGRDRERLQQGRRLQQLVRDRWTDSSGISGLADQLGVSRATLYAWFKGAGSPDTASLTRLARLLRMSPSMLLAHFEESSAPASLELDEPPFLSAAGSVSEDVRMLARAPESWGPASPSLLRRVSAGRIQATRAIRVVDVMAAREVDWCDADDTVGPVTQRMYRSDFSQLPVRDRGSWVGLLTLETIARWTAARTGRGLTYDPATPVREVLPYAEDPANLAIVGRNASAAEVVALFDAAAAAARVLGAVLVTPTGEPHGELLQIVTAADLPKLRAAGGA